MKTLTELINKINAPVFSKVYLRETGEGKYTIYYEGSDAYLAFTKGNIDTIPLKDKNTKGFEIQQIYVPSKDRNNYYARTLLDACIEIAIGDNSNIYLLILRVVFVQIPFQYKNLLILSDQYHPLPKHKDKYYYYHL